MQLSYWEEGQGIPVLCLHESAAGAEIWGPLAAALGRRARTIAPDRRGWGRSAAPEPYLRTTISEQSEDAWELLQRLEAAPALVCGAGLGAVAALDLLVRLPEAGLGAILIEPPLFAFVPEATAALSADSVTLREAFEEGGPPAVLDAYLSGALKALGPGAERLPEVAGDVARATPMTLFAELSAVPDWELPQAAFAELEQPIAVVVGPSTPPLVSAASAALALRLGSGELRELEGAGLPHYDDADELAELVLELG